MKLLLIGDLHLTDKTPRCRIDDFPLTQKGKLQFIMDTAKDNGCKYILQPGDLTDKFTARDSFKTNWIKFFNTNIRQLGAPNFIFVWGQHDMRYHTSDIDDTPLGVLVAGAGFNLIDGEAPWSYGNVNIYGAGWGREIPKVVNQSKFNVLVTHRMIVADKLWAGQESYEVAGTFLRMHDFDLVVSGDNHNKFHYYWKGHGKYLVNCGSLMRSSIDQKDHKPSVFVFDVGSRELKEIPIPIKPFSEVVNLKESEKQEEENYKLNMLREALKKKTNISSKGEFNYYKRVFNRVKLLKESNSINKRTEHFVERIMEDG